MQTEDLFAQELEFFRKEVEPAARFLYTQLAIHDAAAKNPAVVDAINRSPYFWQTILRALFDASIIALGRVFDNGSPHNIAVLFRAAAGNEEGFSKDALAERKRALSANADEWLDAYLASTPEHQPGALREMANRIRHFRDTYEKRYKPIRDKVVAHAEASDEERAALFAETNTAEMQEMFVFLVGVYDALWNLHMNGRPPSVSGLPQTVEEIIENTRAGSSLGPSYPQIVHEVTGLFRVLAAGEPVA